MQVALEIKILYLGKNTRPVYMWSVVSAVFFHIFAFLSKFVKYNCGC